LRLEQADFRNCTGAGNEEGYYNWHVRKGLFFALDVQHVDNPGYNRDRGPAWLGGVLTHVEF
jgi:high affinity Mn2+ porin